ncbi:aminotransferase A [Ammoniphilus sp. CFH 90114]|uniref:aminotransferase A n=1 Tax=Ammoniphilus sp. CFH 90114 TaxID=2493665 RepID=UPI00100FB94B|nr:aminotransferase A [Ammoniphilus sp. CFH 90114]RXT07173.1 aminotransferase A [Ammoniphilus sp. CFH 90114]
MQHLIRSNVKSIEVSGIRKMANLVAQYPDAISLTIGQPDYPTPEPIKKAGCQAINTNKTEYTPNAGIAELRKAIAEFYKTHYNLSYDPLEEVIVTVGATQAIDVTFRTILEEGSEVILPAPIYSGYEPLITLSGAVPVYVDTSINDFKLTADMIERKLTDKTRCILLVSPSNPTGCSLGVKELEAIAILLQDKEIFLISDEIYSELMYDNTHVSIAGLSNMREKTIVINGLSKSHSMTGWRVGYALAPAYLAREMLKVHQYNVSCVSSIGQYAALDALNLGEEYVRLMRESYRERRDYVYHRLTGMGIEVVKPNGAFYMFPSIREFGLSSTEFATQMLQDARVATVPGSAFSNFGEGYIRISYACSLENLQLAMDRMESFVSSLRGG